MAIIGKINDKVLIDDLVFREKEPEEIHIKMSPKGYGRTYYEYRKLTKDGLIKEITKLNNIINKIEKELEQEIAIVGANRTVDNNNPEWWYKLNCYGNILDKLKELKEGK